MSTFKYVAFISYQRTDEAWAKWLHHQLEHYHLPANLGENVNLLQNELRPMFLDEAELAGGNLSESIKTALIQSRNLIVLCSPHSAQSVWVNKEVKTFIDLGRVLNIIPVIIEGVPYACTEEECFVPVLHSLRGTDKEPLGINARYGREITSVKIVAQILGVSFDTLWNRYERDKAIERQRLIEEKRRLQRVESRYLAEKGLNILEDGNSYLARRIAIHALPKNMYDSDDRPFVGAAGELLLNAMNENSMCINFVRQYLYCVAFSLDDKMLAIGGVGLGLRIFDTMTGMEIQKFGTENINHLAFSPNGKRVVCSGYTEISIYDLENSEIMNSSRFCADYSGIVQYSPDGKYIISTKSNPNEIILWKAENLTEIRRFSGHSDRIECVSFSPDGKTLVSGSEDKNVRIWDIQTGDSIRIIDGLNSSVYSVHFNSDGTKLLIGLKSGYVVLFNMETYSFIKYYKEHQRAVYAAKYSEDNMRILSVSCDNDLVVIDIDNDTYDSISHFTQKIPHKDYLRSVAFSSDNQLLATVSDDHTLRLTSIKTDTFQYCKCKYMNCSTPAFCFTPDSKQIIYGGKIKNTEDKIEICKWDIETDSIRKYTMSSEEDIGSIISSSDNKYLVISFYKGIVKLIEANDMTILKEIRIESLHPGSTCFCNNDKEIITFTHKGDINFWDSETLEESRPHLKINSGEIHGKFIINENEDFILGHKYRGKVSLYDIKDGRLIKEICDIHMLFDADFSSDGKYVLIADCSNVELWEIDSQKCIREYKGHESGIRGGQLSPDGKHVMTCDEKTVKIWDIISGECFITLRHHDGRINQIAFSPNGSLCASAAEDGYIKVWNMYRMQDAIDVTRKRFAEVDFTEYEKNILCLE